MTYAVQFKTGLSRPSGSAALPHCATNTKLKIVKFNKASTSCAWRPALRLGGRPKSLGAALAPKVIQDLRQEPFVDAAYVDFPVSPPGPAAARAPRPCRRKRGKGLTQAA
jgi:hypothetical protein